MKKRTYKQMKNRLYREIKRRIILERQVTSPLTIFTEERKVETLKVKKAVPDYLVPSYDVGAYSTIVMTDMANALVNKLREEKYIEFRIEKRDTTYEYTAMLNVVKPVRVWDMEEVYR